jgi:hypothetical protein
MKNYIYLLICFFFYTTKAWSNYDAHYLCYSAGAGVNVGDYRLGSMVLGHCHQLGWFSMEMHPSLKVIVNHPHRSSAYAITQFFSAELSTFVLVYSTNAGYVEPAGRYYGSTLKGKVSTVRPFPGPVFGFGSFGRDQEEMDDTYTKHKVSFYSIGFSLQLPTFWSKASLEIQSL